MKKEALVVPTTHWDRAWFWPFARFRVRLIELVECILDEMEKHPDYRFVMDGQAIPLDDYLEAMPERREKIESLMRSGRLQAGPMFTLPDHYCTGGEAFLRNLLLGEELVRSWGGKVPDMLYLPDSFGFPSDLPTLALGSGYPLVSFMRGLPPEVPPEQRMFFWEAADGFRVRVFRLRDGYGNACWLGRANPGSRRWVYSHEKAVVRLVEAAQKQDDAQGTPLLLLAGIDHMLPQPELDQAMRDATEQSEYAFRYANLDDLAGEVMEKPSDGWFCYRGEFRSTGCAGVLGGTVSTRIFLKRDNAEIERQLACVAEPAEAICALIGRLDPCGAALRLAWKKLLTTHPHDDITGCSVDKVHDDDEFLMDEARDGADAVRRRCVDVLMDYYGGYKAGETRYGFFLINAQPFARTVVQRVVLDFEGRQKWGDEKPPAHYAIVDDSGAEMPFIELRRGDSVEHPHPFVEIELEADLPPFVPCRFYLEPRPDWVLSHPGDMGNDRLQVNFRDDSSFDLRDMKTETLWREIGYLSDQGDCGDSYDFCDIHGDAEKKLDWLRVKQTPLAGCAGCLSVLVEGVVPVPARSDRFGKSSELRELPVAMRLTVFPKSRALNVDLRLTNTVCDHRLRWNVTIPNTVKTARAGQKIGETIHPVRPQPVPAPPPLAGDTGSFDAAEMGRLRANARIHPEFTADQFVAVGDGENGLALLTEFPINYEVVEEEGRQRLAICVLRAVGYLSRKNGEMSTRPGAAGPSTATPGAQLLGRELAFRFQLMPYGVEEGGNLLREALLARAPAVFGLLDARFDPWDGTAPASLVTCDNPHLLFSAFKLAQDRTQIVLRLINPTDSPQSGVLRIVGAKSLQPCLHTERNREKIQPLESDAGEFAISVPAHGLQTYRFGKCEIRRLPHYPPSRLSGT